MATTEMLSCFDYEFVIYLILRKYIFCNIFVKVDFFIKKIKTE